MIIVLNNNSLPKIHKEYDTIPEFRRIIDTTGTPYYEVKNFWLNS